MTTVVAAAAAAVQVADTDAVDNTLCSRYLTMCSFASAGLPAARAQQCKGAQHKHSERSRSKGAVEFKNGVTCAPVAEPMPANAKGARQIKLALIGKPSAEKQALFCAALPDPAAVPAAAVSEGTTYWTASCCPQIPSAACGEAQSCRPCGKRCLPASICELSVPSLNAMAAEDSTLPDVLVVAVPAAAIFRKGTRRASAENFAGAAVSSLRAKLKYNLPILVALSVDTDDGVTVSADEVAAAISDAKAAISAAGIATERSEHSASMQQSTTATATDDTTADSSATCSSSSTAHLQQAAVDVVAVSPWTEK
eukprot:15276-Heterococcus_DN1.PRE.1